MPDGGSSYVPAHCFDNVSSFKLYSDRFFPESYGSRFDNCNFIAFPQNNTRPSSNPSAAAENGTTPWIPPDASFVHQECIHESDSEIYVCHLLPAKRGYPLWRPKPQGARLPITYKQEGVKIGDVGTLNEFGGFSYLFNIFHPADHPINVGRVPPDFKSLPAEEYLDVEEVPIEFEPGTHVTTKASKISRSNIPGPYLQGQTAAPCVLCSSSYCHSYTK